ncbi:MAG: penicillin acylase family protein, partial [Myxococcales bacterium]|nr:penicillin acylase family protein [Myxococcales bacterium]
MGVLQGPRGPIRFERDDLGTPTLFVRDEAESAWARGHVHATDRLVQMHLLHALAHGRAMELLGDRRFARRVDRAVRTLDLQAGLDEAVAAMDPALRGWIETYCQGVRAGAADRGRPLPLRLLGVAPVRWSVRDVLLVYRVLSWFGLTSTTQVAKLAVAELLAEGVDPSALEAFLGPRSAHLDLDAVRAVDWHADEALVGMPVLVGGSNGFAIAGDRTVNGGAIVLAEYHMEIGRLPAGLYPVDIRYDDGRYLCGMSAPGMPYVLAGRTRDTAWAYTFGRADNVDVTVETVQGDRVRRGRRWLDLRVRHEEVRIRGGGRVHWTFRNLPDGTAVLGPGDGAHPGLRWRGLDAADADHQ